MVMSEATLSSTGLGKRTVSFSSIRVEGWRAATVALLGTCALAAVPMSASAAVRFGSTPSESERRPLATGQPSDYHVGRIKADIERLRRERWATAPAVATTVVEVPEGESQPAWRSLVSAPASASAIFPWLTLPGLEVARVASNSLDTGSGLDIFQAPVGKLVAPQLPPLDVPDAYLPESPDSFNGYIWPAAGTITSGYGYRWGRLHRGIDIAGPVGTPILAAGSGEVISAGWSGGYGKLVKLKHRDGSVTYYAHNSRILVGKGQQVRQGQQIAALGNTGRSTGPHLHFEIHTGKGSVNPLALLPKKR